MQLKANVSVRASPDLKSWNRQVMANRKRRLKITFILLNFGIVQAKKKDAQI